MTEESQNTNQKTEQKFRFEMIIDPPESAKQMIDELFKPLSTELPERQFNIGAFTLQLPKEKRSTQFSVALIKAISYLESGQIEVYPLISLGDMTDYNTGMSLTNNMENALNHLCRMINIDLHGVTIIYRDSEREYAGVRIKRFSVDHESAIATIDDVDFLPTGKHLNETQSAIAMLANNIFTGYSKPV